MSSARCPHQIKRVVVFPEPYPGCRYYNSSQTTWFHRDNERISMLNERQSKRGRLLFGETEWKAMRYYGLPALELSCQGTQASHWVYCNVWTWLQISRTCLPCSVYHTNVLADWLLNSVYHQAVLPNFITFWVEKVSRVFNSSLLNFSIEYVSCRMFIHNGSLANQKE